LTVIYITFNALSRVPNGALDMDLLANEWEVEDLQDWGVDLPDLSIDDDVDSEIKDAGGQNDNVVKIIIEIDEKDQIALMRDMDTFIQKYPSMVIKIDG
jgi:hypothetical protein